MSLASEPVRGMMDAMFEVARSFNALYIWLDLAWLAAFSALLAGFRRYLALLAGLAGGIIYFLVDYGVFYLALGTRSVEGGSPFWVLLWLSFSYGLTNFAWIWLLLDRDGNGMEWTLLIVAAWMAIAQLARSFGSASAAVVTSRGTVSYHGVMALVLLAGYAWIVVRNLRLPPRDPRRASLGRLLAIGIGVQLAWEAVLVVSGIRPLGWQALVVNSLVETNLGLPYLYLIHRALARRIGEDLHLR